LEAIFMSTRLAPLRIWTCIFQPCTRTKFKAKKCFTEAIFLYPYDTNTKLRSSRT